MVCKTFNFKGDECFTMTAVDFFVYLNYCIAEIKEHNRREREAQARLRAKH